MITEEKYSMIDKEYTCAFCPLYEYNRNIVIGEGPSPTNVMFIGEAPGENENEEERPFIGRSGQLLRSMIRDYMSFNPEDVYITNIVKCRPPGNRTPTWEEIESCEPNLLREIDAVDPDVIVMLGNTAIETLTGERGVTNLHGKFIADGGSIMYYATFHPSAALRRNDWKEDMIADLIKLNELL